MSKTFKRALSVLMAVVMAVSLMSVTAFAADVEIFTDVSEKDACYPAVMSLYEAGYMLGTGNSEFSPNSPVTRGMAVTVLYRLAGEPIPSGVVNFTDFQTNEYYSNAVIWATRHGIINGYPDGTVRVNATISASEANAIISRYAANIAGKEMEAPLHESLKVTRSNFAVAIYNLITVLEGKEFSLDTFTGDIVYVLPGEAIYNSAGGYYTQSVLLNGVNTTVKLSKTERDGALYKVGSIKDNVYTLDRFTGSSETGIIENSGSALTLWNMNGEVILPYTESTEVFYISADGSCTKLTAAEIAVSAVDTVKYVTDVYGVSTVIYILEGSYEPNRLTIKTSEDSTVIEQADIKMGASVTQWTVGSTIEKDEFNTIGNSSVVSALIGDVDLNKEGSNYVITEDRTLTLIVSVVDNVTGEFFAFEYTITVSGGMAEE